MILADKKLAYDKLIEDLIADGKHFENCNRSYEVGALYAINLEHKTYELGNYLLISFYSLFNLRYIFRYRVRIISNCPTIMEFMDDVEPDSLGRRNMTDLFEEEDLLKLPPKYTEEDLLVCETFSLFLVLR